jgi:hypothetical protein
VVFIELPLFGKYFSFTDDELAAVQERILDDPRRGDLIPGGRGLRKLRAAVAGRGKRGGARVIYYVREEQDRCYLIFAYAKNDQDDLTAAQLKALAAVMDEEFGDGQARFR